MRLLVQRKAKRVRTKAVVRHRLHVTKGDTVQVISGEFKGKRGRVLRVHPKTGRVTVEGVNVVKRHKRQTPTAEGEVNRPRIIRSILRVAISTASAAASGRLSQASRAIRPGCGDQPCGSP